jgi:hypothetical protein
MILLKKSSQKSYHYTTERLPIVAPWPNRPSTPWQKDAVLDLVPFFFGEQRPRYTG